MSDIFRDFDKKNEFSKVSIDRMKIGGKELAGELANNILNGKFDLGIEKIAKDIVKRQDNAMAMEFTKCIGELLRKNGVFLEITEYTNENMKENSIEHRYEVTIDELDFSEHDKVFEDKIAKLEKEVAEWKSEAREIKKNRDEQLKSVRKAVEPYVDIGHMHETIAELKQRIAELEEKNKNLVDMINELQLEKAHIDCDLYDANKRIAELESKETSDLPFDPLECANYLINATYERETNGIERAFHNLPEKVNSDRYTVDELEQIAERLLIYCKHNKE